MQNNIAIIDYGMGNLRSVYKALYRLNAKAIVTSDRNELTRADKLILPGVGHFKNGITKLLELQLVDILNELVIVKKKPILGICLGMQLFTNYSEEGETVGLKWINAQTRRFSMEGANKSLKVPHMGWNTIEICKNGHLLKDIDENSMFYFVHSYFISCNNKVDILSTSKYGIDFVSSFQKDNIMGVQFHPEKSHNDGLTVLRNFINL